MAALSKFSSVAQLAGGTLLLVCALITQAAPADLSLVSRDFRGEPTTTRDGQTAVSPDGRYVAFLTTDPEVTGDALDEGTHLIVRDRQVGENQLLVTLDSGISSFSEGIDISADGRFVVFASRDSFLPGDENNIEDCFVADRRSGIVRRMNEALGGGDSTEPCCV